MKKFISLLLSLSMLFVFAACQSDTEVSSLGNNAEMAENQSINTPSNSVQIDLTEQGIEIEDEQNDDSAENNVQISPVNIAQIRSSDYDVEFAYEWSIGARGDDTWITFVDTIQTDFDNYVGKTVRYQGVFTSLGDFSSVVRFTPLCCGPDGGVGFLVVYDGEKPETLDNVEITGTFGFHDIGGDSFRSILVSSMEVLSANQAAAPRHIAAMRYAEAN